MKKILIVGKDREFANEAAEILKRALTDINIDSCPSGEEALKSLKSKVYDLVVSKNVLEDMTGYGFLEAVSELGGYRPVIMVSSSWKTREMLKYMRAGAYEYVTNEEELIVSSRKALEFGELLKETSHFPIMKPGEDVREELSRIRRVLNDEVNNPLMAIIGTVQLLLEKGDAGNREFRAKLMTIEESARRIGRAMDLVIDFNFDTEINVPLPMKKKDESTALAAVK